MLFVQMGEHGQCCKDSNECLRKMVSALSTSKTGAFVMPRWLSEAGSRFPLMGGGEGRGVRLVRSSLRAHGGCLGVKRR